MVEQKRFITLQDGGYTITQSHAFSDIYQVLIGKDDKIIFNALTDYMPEPKLIEYLKGYISKGN